MEVGCGFHHEVHRHCFANHINSTMANKNFPIKCPSFQLCKCQVTEAKVLDVLRTDQKGLRDYYDLTLRHVCPHIHTIVIITFVQLLLSIYKLCTYIRRFVVGYICLLYIIPARDAVKCIPCIDILTNYVKNILSLGPIDTWIHATMSQSALW